VPASSKSGTALAALLAGYQFCAGSEGKSAQTIGGVFNSVRYLDQFLRIVGVPSDALAVGRSEIRGFILYLSLLHQQLTTGSALLLLRAGG
jgi:hypothetical protein